MRILPCLALGAGLWMVASAQVGPVTPAPNAPLDAEARLDWWANSVFGPTSWFAGGASSGWSTILNSPREWKRSPEGFGRRLATRTANVGISNGLDAGLGAIWGEDPRYLRQGSGGFRARAGHALRMTVLSRYADGRTRPAWARLIGNAGADVAQNYWMPPGGQGAGRIGLSVTWSIAARAGSNVFQEFWPDLRKRVFRK